MANEDANSKQLRALFRFRGANVDKVDFTKRRVLNLLPPVHQTETLQKFFKATADHLFEPGQSKPLNGYIGRPVNYAESNETFYISEESRERQFYQLEPAMVSVGEDGSTKSLLFYEDLINSLRFQGGITNNHHRMFTQDYFSWCPSIDLDKFLNFREYCWVPEGPTPVEIRGHAAEYKANGTTQMFTVSPDYPKPAVDQQVSVTVDGIEVPFTYDPTSGQVVVTPAPARDSIVKVYTAISIREVEGKETFTFQNDVVLSSNMRVVIRNDRDTAEIGKIYIVEGVGEGIILVPDDEVDLTLKSDYVVIQRGAYDNNPWSTKNRWFHKDLLTHLSRAQLKEQEAKRPIIEFVRNIKLFNFGTKLRGKVDLVSHTTNDFLGAINGYEQSVRRIDGVFVNREWIEQNGTNNAIRVLVLNDDDDRVNNRIYRITFNPTNNKLKATLVADGGDVSGAPVIGEIIEVSNGVSLGGSNLHWNGEQWIKSQSKVGLNQAPLFDLFDANGISLGDVGTYPNSSFSGCKLFGYRENTALSTPLDKVLNLRLVYDAKGEIVFENYLATYKGSYRVGVDNYDLPTKRFYKIVGKTSETLVNDWYEVAKKSRQMVVDTVIAHDDFHMYSMSQEPIDTTEENLKVYRNNELQRVGEDFIVRGNQVLLTQLDDGDRLDIKTFNPKNKAMNTPGQYEIPLNLEANPTWEQIEYVSRGDVFEQFIEIIRSQKGFKGLEYSSNNWRDLRKDLSVGRHIVSHTAPLLRTMLLAANKDIDFVKSIAYAQDEYARFRGKFDQKIREYLITNAFANETPAEWVDRAIEEIARGFTKDFPFFYSRMAQVGSNPTFIPPTPSFLGLFPIQKPHFYTDPILGNKFIIGHDGSSFPSYGDIRDDVTLELEMRIYNSAPDYVREREEGFFDHFELISNKHYTADYSVEEFNTIIRSMFEKWSVSFGIDYRTNDIFDPNDPFTWNWSSCVDRDNRPLPGHWKGIYRYYYGTERPHTHPWEMLGFQYKPEWWEARYGKAPYGSGNIPMWRDIQAGKIAEGPRAGTYERFAKPGLLNMLPVDDQGRLLDPLRARITANPPRSTKMQDEWVWGDGAPAESAWKLSYWYPFALCVASYLMKPPSFVEASWDVERNLEVNRNKGFGYPYKDEYVHSETAYDGSVVYRHGSQQWVVDYLKSKNKDATEYLGNLIRGLDVRLAYKVAGFTDSKSLYVISDNIDRIPPEDVQVQLYKSPSIREEFLGGVVLRRVENGWRLFGYDILDPVFKIIPSDVGSRSESVSISGASRVRIQVWKPTTYYSLNTTVRYIDKFYRAIKPHTSTRNFEPQYWVEVARPTFADTTAVEYYTEPKLEGAVERVPYGTTFRSPQEVATFISGYDRYLRSRGWRFETVSDNYDTIYDWKNCLRDFLRWVQSDESQIGDMITLIPNSSQVQFNTEHGYVEPIEQIVNGVYSILDKNGNPIKSYNTNIVRDDGNVSIQTIANQEMYAVRLYVSEIEHAIVINNRTIFSDMVYNPLFNIRQPRLRLQGFKTKGWRGRVDAPGFIITGDKIRVNFEKAADDFRRLFDIETTENTEMKDRARANYGYQEKSYLSNLLLTPMNQFEFHQGVIQQKGTISAMRKLFRSNFIRHNEGLNVLEEWSFRIGEYGASEIRPSLDFLIKQSDFKNDPQLFQFNGSGQGGWDLRLAWDMDHWDYLKQRETVRKTYSIGGIRRVRILEKGAGYTEAPRVEVPAGSNGASLSAILDWSDSRVTGIEIVRGGAGFFIGDVVEFEGNGVGATAYVSNVDYAASKITSVFVAGGTPAGSGYSVGQKIRFTSGGNGNGTAEITRVDSNGGILELSVTNPGAGYRGIVGSIQWPNNNNSAAGKIGMRVTGGRILAITVTNGGSGYEPNTTCRVGRGSGAILRVKVSGGSISGVQVVNPGSGFTEEPVLQFVGGNPTTPAQAVAELDTRVPETEIQIGRFKKINGVILKSITVIVHTEFGGVQPMLTIGDQDYPDRYIGEINLSTVQNKTFSFEDGDRIANADYDIIGFVTNAHNMGSLEILFTFEYTPNYYLGLLTPTLEDNSVKIEDMFDNETGDFMHKDPRWVWRHETRNPDWPLVEIPSDRKGNLPSAGYVHLDDVRWTTTNMSKFNALFRRQQRSNPSTPIVNRVDIKFEPDTTQVRRRAIIPNLYKGMYRVKNFVVDITEAFPELDDGTPNVSISIGTSDNSELFMPRNAVDTSNIQQYTHQVYNFITAEKDINNEIFVFIYQEDALSIAPGKMSVTANIEMIDENQVLPRDLVWVYSGAERDWDVFRLGDTGMNIEHTYVPSHNAQGTIVSVNKDVFDTLGIEHNYQMPRKGYEHLNPTFEDDFEQAESRMDRIILDGIIPDSNQGEMLLNTYRAKLRNSVKLYIDAASIVAENGTALVQIPIMNLLSDAGMVINKISASVVSPFVYPVGNNPTITIGTLTDRDYFIGEVNSQSAYRSVKPEPERPTFSYSSPIKVNLYDDVVVVNEQDTHANIRLLRSGNIFVTPTHIEVINGGWGYDSSSMPKINVQGPTGVKATPRMVGKIIGYAVTNAGSGYTSTPTVTVVGGGGTGAQAEAVISNGKIKEIIIPGAGKTTATATVTSGVITGVQVDTTTQWEMEPIVTFEGGNPQRHGTARVEMDEFGGIIAVHMDYEGLGYTSAPTVKFHPQTGEGYVGEPRIVISGGGGNGATAVPIMLWTVESISITDWGKCSWAGDGASVTVQAPEGGAPAVAKLHYTPEQLEPTTIQQWRYRVVEPITHPAYNVWVNVDETIEFPAPNGMNGPDYWVQKVSLPVEEIDERTTFEIEFPEFVLDQDGNSTGVANLTNANWNGTRTSNVTIVNTIEGSRDIDLTRKGTKEFIINERMNEDNTMVLFYNSDGVTSGLLTLVVDYHYTQGFELFQANTSEDIPMLTTITGSGGDIFAWNSVRFANTTELKDPKRLPVDGWKITDRILLDDGRLDSERAEEWKQGYVYNYHDTALHNGVAYRAIQSGRGLAVTVEPIPNGLGNLQNPVIVERGTRYSHEPQVTIEGDGTGAAARVLLGQTSVYKIKIKNINENFGYTGEETIRIIPKNDTGTGAKAQITRVEDGSIKEITVTDQGSGYDAAPYVVIENDTALVPVELEAVLVPTKVKAILYDNRGENYTYATMTFTEHYNDPTNFNPQEWEETQQGVKGWRVFEYINRDADSQWEEVRRETPKIDSELIESAEIYDTQTGVTLQTLQLYDPFKGFIPGSAKREIHYILNYDPAIYSHGPLAKAITSNEKLWDSAKVGDIWWDITNTFYLDYEIGETEYKWSNWGKLAPGSQINIYEWTRSTVPPELWANEVEKNRKVITDAYTHKPTGTVKGINGTPSWVERTEYNPVTGRDETVYYFWVKGASTLPPRQDRNLTARQITTLLTNPNESDIPWFAVIDTNKVIVGGAKSYVNDYSTSLKINWKRSKNDGLIHKEWKILRENDERNTIDPLLWNKMRDSLVGWDDTTRRMTFSAAITSEINSDSTSFTVDDATGFDLSGEVKIGNYWLQYEYLNGNTFTNVSGLGDLYFGVGTRVYQTRMVEDFQKIPNQWLNERERYGSLRRPGQTWFRTDTDEFGYIVPGRESRKTFVDTLNEIFSRDRFLDTRYEWQEVLVADEPEPDVSEYTFAVSDMYERDQLVAYGEIKPGQKVLLHGTPETNGFWTLWVYVPDDARADNSGYVMLRAQRYRLREGELWTAVDWYADGWSTSDFPVRRYRTIKERDADTSIKEVLLRGTLVRVDEQGPNDKRWAWYVLQDGNWTMVAKEKSTIRLNDNFYRKGTIVYGFDTYQVAHSKNRDGSWELQFLINQLRTKMLTSLERNKLFFSMVKNAVSQHTYTDWAFKTSFLYMAGYDEKLSQSPIVYKSQIENVLDYINDIKPYHVKVRDFVRRLKVPTEYMNLSITDFDKPLWFDPLLNKYRKLDVNDADDAAILSSDPQLRHWYENYQKTNYSLEHWDENWNPIRRPRIRMLFDRVSCKSIVGWDQPELPWDGNQQRWIGDRYTYTFAELETMFRQFNRQYKQFVVNDIAERDALARESQSLVNSGNAPIIEMGDVFIVKSNNNREVSTYMWSGQEFVEFFNVYWDSNWSGGLADRIEKYYEPTATMRRKELATLIRGCDFRGTIVDGSTSNYGLWDMFAWDITGWDNEYDYFVSRDININPISSGLFDETEEVEDIRIEGGEMSQPWFDGGHPDELVRLRVRDPLTITVFRQATSNGDMVTTKPTTFRFFKDSLNTWEGVYLEDDGITLAEDLNPADNTIRIAVSGTLELHDPAYATSGIKSQAEIDAYRNMLRQKLALSIDIDLSQSITAGWVRSNALLRSFGFKEMLDGVDDNDVVNTLVETRLDEILSHYTSGVVWIGTERIEYSGITDNGDGTYTLTGALRGSGGTSRMINAPAGTPVYDGSVLHALVCWNSKDMRAHSIWDYSNNLKSWSKAAEAAKAGPVA